MNVFLQLKFVIDSNNTLKFWSSALILAISLILLLLVLRIVNCFVSDFPILILPHTRAVWVDRMGTIAPLPVTAEFVLPGEFLPEFPDLKLNIKECGSVLKASLNVYFDLYKTGKNTNSKCTC